MLTLFDINTTQLQLSQQHNREPPAPRRKAGACERPSTSKPGTLGACMLSPETVIMTP